MSAYHIGLIVCEVKIVSELRNFYLSYCLFTVRSFEQVAMAFSFRDQSRQYIDLACSWGIWHTGKIYLNSLVSNNYWTS